MDLDYIKYSLIDWNFTAGASHQTKKQREGYIETQTHSKRRNTYWYLFFVSDKVTKKSIFGGK